VTIFKELAARRERQRNEAADETLTSLVDSALERKKEIPGEKSAVIRIEQAMRKGEIQLVGNFPPNEPEEPLALRLGSYEDEEELGRAVFLVVKIPWIEKAAQSRSRSDLDLLYNGLKAALEEIRALKADGCHLLTKGECQPSR
jgi:hypothetical protein